MNDRMLWEKLQSEYYAEWAEMFGYEVAQLSTEPVAEKKAASVSLSPARTDYEHRTSHFPSLRTPAAADLR